MKPQELFFLLSNAKNKQEFIRILRANRIPVTIGYEEIYHKTKQSRKELIEKENKK